jgi:tetratricopeptide (TPR) repeat protein
MKNLIKFTAIAATLSASFVFSNGVYAQEGEAAAKKPAAPVLPVMCPGYKPGKTNLPGERTGKKVAKAFEAYNQDLTDEAIEILLDISTNDAFDKAYVNRFVGNIMAAAKGRQKEALVKLTAAVDPKELNDREHADTLRLLGDLNLQEKEYRTALKWYNAWMDFTCKEDPAIYTRITQAHYELKELDKMVDPANKAIALYAKEGKPNKNPYVLKLTSFYERKMYPQTVLVAEELVRNFPDNKQWWSQLGFFYMLVEDYKKALSTFEVAYQEGFLEKVSQIKAMAQLYSTNDMPYKAAKLLEKHIDSGLIEKNETSYSQLANAYHSAKYHSQAAKYYGIAAKFENNPEMFRKQGILLIAAEDFKGAVVALENAIEAGAEDPARIHFSLMEANFYQNKFRTAYKHALEAKKSPAMRRNANAWTPYIKEKAKNRGITI